MQAAQIALEKAQLNPALTFIDTRGAWISIDLRENQLGNVELVGGLENWPKAAKAGGKVAAVVYSSGQSNPVAWLSYAIFRVKSVLSYLY